jgi:shoulder domain-containing protein
MDERNSKRDLVLAPSEYAYMQDVTKGIVKTYTGPTVINPTAQERPVVFDPDEKQFAPCTLEAAVQQIAIAPEGYYIILKNPSQRNDHPPAGSVHPAPDLDVGRKINITGPCAFALWPGQMVKLVQGHHLRSNQYVLVRVYNEDEARKTAELSVGKLYIIKGTDVSFYIPPTGVGVVPDANGRWVRDALTLERLEYCILVDQNGKKRYERGPQVVFPEPTETFIGGKQRAIELSELEGLHVKVIAPYDQLREGNELFITGKETSIYYPREEHVLVGAKHAAIAVRAGEARYVLNRKTGEIRTVRGPAMLLPNPIAEVLVERTDGVPSTTAVSVGYAVLVVDKQGRRRVEQGPKNLTLEYDETLEVQQLSSGTPKTDDKLIETVFLRVLNNKVSDGCVVETLDHVSVTLRYSLRVSFEGEPARWFEVENYVRFLCDHVRSVLKGTVKKHAIEGFYAQSVEIIRDGILGKTDDKGGRQGMRFPENGMHVTDLELLEVGIDDDDIASLLGDAQHEAVQANIALLRARRGLEMTEKQEAIARGEAAARAQTAHERAVIELAAAADQLEQTEAQRQTVVARNAVADTEHAAELARRRAAAALEHDTRAAQQELVLAALRAEVDAAVQRFGAAQGGFSEALLALSNHDTLAKVAEAMSVQAFVGGKTLTDVIDKVFAGTPLQGVMERVKTRVGNGAALPAPKSSRS